MVKKNNKKLLGIIYPLLILLFMITTYIAIIVNLFLLNGEKMFSSPFPTIFSIIYLFIVHLLLSLVIYCYLRVMFKNPGEPPQFWGFNDKPEERRKRYCMICNKFKPERCHHCSTCGRCVLVMDHHCPWLNNCVGFRNRKLFMLLLIYAMILGFFMVTGPLYPLFLLMLDFFKKDFNHLFRFFIGFIGLVLATVYLVTIKLFISYHFNLIDKNMTTIDHLDEKRGNFKDFDYDFGKEFNWKSIFGQNKIFWILPIETGGGKPHGDGTVFMKNMKSDKKINLMEEDEDFENDYYNMEDDDPEENWDNDKKYEDPLNKLNNQNVGNPLKEQGDIFAHPN